MEETLVLANRLEELGRLADWLHGLAAAWGMDQEAVAALDLALEEAVVNVMSHAYGPEVELPIVVRLGRRDGEARAQVEDQGPAYDPLAVPEPDPGIPLLERSPGGLGVFLSRRVLDSMSWERREGVNVLTMIKRLRGRGPEGM